MKQAIIIPGWLNMSPGKVASQACHAALSAGYLTDKRVILRADSLAHIKAIEKLVDFVRDDSEDALFNLSFGYFTDSGPTTEGTDGVITAYWVRGKETLVNSVTEDMELY